MCSSDLYDCGDIMNGLSSESYVVGQLVATSRLLYWHLGIVTDRWERGEQVVISCSNRQQRVVEERMSVFAQGSLIERRQALSNLSGGQAVMRARTKLGQAYNLLDWNCEHFVYYAFGLNPESPQIGRAILLGLAGVVIKSQ